VSHEHRVTFLQLETYHGLGPKDRHGLDGPIHVSEGTFSARSCQDDFILAAEKLGWSEIFDLQDLESNNGVQRALRYVSPDGKRQDVAHAYLHPRLLDDRHPNLHVLVESRVTRILSEGKKAIGVEYVQKAGSIATPDPHNPGTRGSPRSIRARRLVIASSGACGTPPLLERSGIGHREILERAGVDLVAHVPGVGEGYSDHELLVSSYRSSFTPEETLDALLRGDLDQEELIRNNDSILSWNSVSITSKVRPTEAEVAALGPEFEEAYNRDFKNNLNKPLCLLTMMNRWVADAHNADKGHTSNADL